MNYGEIKNCDIANGIGVRVTLFVSGCTNHCDECFQPQTWDFGYGQPFTEETEEYILKLLAPSYIDGLTVLAASPSSRKTSGRAAPLCAGFGKNSLKKGSGPIPGSRWKSCCRRGPMPIARRPEELLRCIDVLVDGRFIKEKKDISLRFRGSSNQRLIDMNKTRETGEIVLWDD